ncbi:MAG: energy transducer TonB [Bacteroidales bacterium]|jgi:protein TonB|nr:energy transducer TonB [Bacteroidales bacterium]
MSEKKSPKVDLESRLVNFFLLGCAIGLTLSLLGLDIWASVKSNAGASISTEAEPAVEDLQMPNTDIETPPPPEPEQAPEQEEVVEQILKETQEEVATTFEFSMEADEETAIEGDDEEIDANTEVVEIEEPIERVPQVRAEFPGGMAELRKYLFDNCQYPESARQAGWQGVVMLEFVVEKDGRIGQVNVLRSVCPALDEEAIRVVKGMPKWKAGENNGQKCRSFFQLPITFSLQ